MRALIGHTGFVGGNLQKQTPFDAFFHSRNIEEIAGRDFDLIVCAGAPAEKWRANADPEKDRVALARLSGALSTTTARRFVLISTVDVYPLPVEVDERTAIDRRGGQPYGANRLALEDAIRTRFTTTVVRLPALFGNGLKKNALFDLLHDHETEKIDGRGSFQFYDVERLWQDLGVAVKHGLEILNLVTEPIAIEDIASRFFGRSLAEKSSPPPRYDVRSVHAHLWQRDDGYQFGAKEVLDSMKAFLEHERERARPDGVSSGGSDRPADGG